MGAGQSKSTLPPIPCRPAIHTLFTAKCSLRQTPPTNALTIPTASATPTVIQCKSSAFAGWVFKRKTPMPQGSKNPTTPASRTNPKAVLLTLRITLSLPFTHSGRLPHPPRYTSALRAPLRVVPLVTTGSMPIDRNASSMFSPQQKCDTMRAL